MSEKNTTTTSRPGQAWAWAALGVLVGAGCAAWALKRKQLGDSRPMDTLDKLFDLCERDCEQLESRCNGLQAKAS